MDLRIVFLFLVASLSALTTASATEHSSLDSFLPHFRCPFSKLWIEHGPERAAEILGVSGHSAADPRRLLAGDDGDAPFGSCSYTNAFTGQPTCVNFLGDAWTQQAASERCSTVMPGVSGAFSASACPMPDPVAGLCLSSDGAEATVLSGPCEMAKEGCETWSRGTFQAMGGCAQTAAPPTQPSAVQYGPGGGGSMECRIAPGPAGAAHQLGASTGYGNNCEGTPAQQSPFMWPEAWTANFESQSLDYATGNITYTSRGRVWYRLDKNWKRSDIHFQEGIQFTVGQGPCPEEDRVEGAPNKCRRHPTSNTTMIHRGSRMVFIHYAPGKSSLEDIVNCTVLDMGMIGNIRPDWFLDNVGVSTDVQYIGNSHVYYLGQPKLVKQWRKQDFASQYFTMSMAGYPSSDGVHWPLILNVPGEGFGDDFLQHYSEHKALTDADLDEFLLDEAYEAMGGTCFDRTAGGGSGGPPHLDEPIPSNLEKEDSSWRSIEYTYSPIYTPAKGAAPQGAAESPLMGAGELIEIEDGVFAEACIDGNTLNLAVSAKTPEPVWMAVGFRESERCIMTPTGGRDGEVVWAQPEEGGAVSVKFGMLPPAIRGFDNSISEQFLGSLQPFKVTPDLTDGSSYFGDGQMTVTFKRSYSSMPQEFNLNFAHGSSSNIGYHTMRGCFQLKDLPTCGVPPGCPVCNECGGGITTAASYLSSSDRDSSTSAGIFVRMTSKGVFVAAAFALAVMLNV